MMQPEKVFPKFSTSTKAEEKVTDVDDVLQKIKPFGRYQLLVSAIYAFAYFQGILNNLFMGFGGIKPKWICSDPSAYNSSTIDPTTPTDNCAVYKACPRENLTYVSDFYSIASEWNLVCDNDYFLSLMPTIQMIGLLTGALMIGPVSDQWGRKWTFFAVMTLELALGALSALAPSATVFAVFRFLIGWCIGAENVVGWVFTAEATTNRYRFLVKIVAAVGLPYWNQVLLAYLTQHWKWYSIIGNLEGIPILPILVFFSYESPRWLAQKGRIEEAKQILAKIARFNRTSHLLPENIELETDASKTEGPQKTYHVWDLFRTRRLATYTLVCSGTWFAVSLANYGMYFNIGNLPTNVYVTGMVLAGVYDLIIPMAIYDAYNPKFNRKYMMVGLFLVAAVCNTAIALFQTVIPDGSASDALLTMSSILGLASTEAIFDTAYVYAIELFPTLLRSNAGGLSSVSARVGGAIAPQLLYAGKAWTPLPYVIFASIALFGFTIDALFLPNTKNMHLPETFEQSNRKPSENFDASFQPECGESESNGPATVSASMQWVLPRDSVATILYDDERTKRASYGSIEKY